MMDEGAFEVGGCMKNIYKCKSGKRKMYSGTKRKRKVKKR